MALPSCALGLTLPLALLGCAPAAAPSTVAAASAGPEVRPASSNTGVVCTWAITNALRQIGTTCFAGQDAEFQQALAQGVGDYDRYMMAKGSLTQAQVDSFKREQGFDGSVGVCESDMVSMYTELRDAGPAALKAMVAADLARPGPPTWGSCL